jgi:alkanesulfonate monooxygenase SsuD/methylene tetrahydromethanopterin reductase-like flavin-dependent oxidoreductase (luciferase family)
VQGWMPQELAVAGVPMQRRGDGWDAYLGALRAVWGPDPVSYAVEPYVIPPSHIGPKPARPIGVIMGYSSAAGIRRAARVADGLLPFQTDLATLRAHLSLFRSCAADAGRDPAALPIILRVAASTTPGDALLNGPLSRWVDDLGELAALGVDHVLVGLGPMPVDAQLELLADLRPAGG